MRGVDEIDSSGKANTEVSAVGATLVEAGLMVIDSMRRTTGSGVPERGEAFRLGAQRFLAAGDLAGSAQPRDWTGPAAQTYARANQGHIGSVTSIAALDSAVHAVLARQADQVLHHRSEIDEEADRLAHLSRTSRDLDSAHGVGAAMKAAVEMAAVNSALDACTEALSRLSQLAKENNDELRGIAGEYADLADLADLAAEPFVPAAATAAPASTPADPAGTDGDGSMPSETLSALTSALGAAGGMIGTTIAPLAAALTGAAGAAVQALSALPAADAEATPDRAGNERADVDTDEPESDEDREADDGDPAEEPADPAPEDASAEPAPLLPPAVPSPAEPPPAPIRPPR